MSQHPGLPLFLDRLPVAPAVRRDLAELGVDTPLELLGMIRAARLDFARWLGDDLVVIETALEAQITPEERASLDDPLPEVRTGARLEPAPRGGREGE